MLICAHGVVKKAAMRNDEVENIFTTPFKLLHIFWCFCHKSRSQLAICSRESLNNNLLNLA